MADKNSNTGSPDAIGEAMNQVLRAEREAGQIITGCEDEAREILRTAQQQAQRISVRTDKRIVMCHMRATARATREIRAREATEKALPLDESAQHPDSAGLAEIAMAMAEELTDHAPPSDSDDQKNHE